jgi:hypothetical protein
VKRHLAPRNRRTEDVRVHAVVVAELKLGNVQSHVFPADFVERADNTALEDRPESLNRVGVWTAPMTYLCALWRMTSCG